MLGLVTFDPSPELAILLSGVTTVKLYLGGVAVRDGLTIEELAERAAKKGVSLLLLSGETFGLAGDAAPARFL